MIKAKITKNIGDEHTSIVSSNERSINLRQTSIDITNTVPTISRIIAASIVETTVSTTGPTSFILLVSRVTFGINPIG